MKIFTNLLSGSIVFLSLLSISFGSFGACNFTVVEDKKIAVGTGDTGKRRLTPEVSTLQEAVDIARECEFQTVGFTVPSGSTLDVISESNQVINNNPSTLPWVGGVDAIEQYELIQIGGSGKWYEVKSVTATSITLTRGVNLPSGSYSYAVSEWTDIVLLPIPGRYEGANIDGLHYVSIYTKRGANALIAGAVGVNSEPPAYGHLWLETIDIVKSGAGIPLYLRESDFNGNETETEHDVDLTIIYTNVMSMDGFDAIQSNYHGNILVQNSRFDSGNDVAFFPFGNGFLPPRSVTINDSMFFTHRNSIVDTGYSKALMIEGRANGGYSVNNSFVSLISDKGNSVGIFFSSNEGASLSINNVNVSCTSCTGSGTGYKAGAISARGAGVTVFVKNSDIAVSRGSCTFAVDEGATIVTTNTNWPYDQNGAPAFCADSGGTVVVQ